MKKENKVWIAFIIMVILVVLGIATVGDFIVVAWIMQLLAILL